MSKKYIISVLAALSCAGLAQGQTLLYEYNFNDYTNGTYTLSTGSESATANFTNYVEEGSPAREAYNLFGSSGSGVSGLAGDYAFNNTASTQMGGNSNSAGYGGAAMASSNVTAFSGLSSYTISGWYNASVLPSNYARLIEIGGSSDVTSLLFQGSAGSTSTNLRLRTKVGGTTYTLDAADDSENPILLLSNAWVFFAVTVDGVNGTMTIYAGTDETSVVQMSTVSIGTGTVTVGGSSMAIGNSLSNNQERPFDGLMDNVRIWGSDTDASGALDISTLESIRASDTVPEPSAYAALIGAMVLALALLRRR
ncbi:MAG: LamG-like jellyroll fold domain-containing protein [Puniceicoccales bacterium]